MQIGLKTTTGSATAAFIRTPTDTTQPITAIDRTARDRVVVAQFPEAALLSRRPLRYNIQLNRQLTAMQQAENYLSETEKHLLVLRHQAARGNVVAPLASLHQLLQQRSQASGGTVDRNLNVTLQQKSHVNFTLPAIENVLQQPGGEILVFALGGNKREYTAVSLPQQPSPRQTLIQLNIGLGRLGIHAALNDQGKCVFQVSEDRWTRVNQYLSVRGEGLHFPADAFTLLTSQAEASREDEIGLLSQQWTRGASAKLQNTLNKITRERTTLHHHQERVSSRIKDMSTFYTPKEALETSRALSQILANSIDQYQLLSKALSVQGNVRAATVRNILG